MKAEVLRAIVEARLAPLTTRYAPAVAVAQHHAPVCVECYKAGRIKLAVAWGKVLRSDPDLVTWQGYCQNHHEARIERARLRLLEKLHG